MVPSVRSPPNPDVIATTEFNTPPVMIGCRGASGERPEYTLAADNGQILLRIQNSFDKIGCN